VEEVDTVAADAEAGPEQAGVEPEGFLGYRLVRVAQGLEARFKAALAVFELSPRQFSVLAVLVERPEVTVAEIARAVLTTPQSMAALTEGLEAQGLVVRGGPRRRGVAAPLAPTAEGRDLVARATPAVLEMEREVFAGLPHDRMQGLRSALAALETRLDL
jgi:DNA-binding MarR family transcriptional regulator